MSREVHVQFCERAGVQFPCATHLVILCRSREAAEAALAAVREWTTAAGLTLHPTKTRIVNAEERGGFDFLGYHFERGYRWPRKKSLDKFKAAIRAKTGRLRPGPLGEVIDDVNRTLRGWMQYFQHSHRNTFPRLDQWIRQRLRSILRKRHKLSGRARGRDHQRWPNDYFVACGLISLALMHRKAAKVHTTH